MMVKRDWTNDIYAFQCAQAMDEMGIRIVAITISVYPERTLWSVWGQGDHIDYNDLDRRTNLLIDYDYPARCENGEERNEP